MLWPELHLRKINFAYAGIESGILLDPIIMTSLKKIHFLLVVETMRFRLNDMKTNFDQTLIINLS